MCARAFYLLLAALFVYLVVTVAAFRYLDWWQALLVSAATFLSLVLGGRWLVRYMVRTSLGRVGEMAKGLFDAKSKVLRGATVSVHSVRSTEVPQRLAEVFDDPQADGFDRAEIAADLHNLRWYQVEATVFPDPAQGDPMTHWDLDDLRLVPANATPPAPFGEDVGEEFELHELVLIDEGAPVIPVDGKVTGPRRLRFVVGVPPAVPELQFRYYFEQFGRVVLAGPPALPPPRAAE